MKTVNKQEVDKHSQQDREAELRKSDLQHSIALKRVSLLAIVICTTLVVHTWMTVNYVYQPYWEELFTTGNNTLLAINKTWEPIGMTFPTLVQTIAHSYERIESIDESMIAMRDDMHQIPGELQTMNSNMGTVIAEISSMDNRMGNMDLHMFNILMTMKPMQHEMRSMGESMTPGGMMKNMFRW